MTSTNLPVYLYGKIQISCFNIQQKMVYKNSTNPFDLIYRGGIYNCEQEFDINIRSQSKDESKTRIRLHLVAM